MNKKKKYPASRLYYTFILTTILVGIFIIFIGIGYRPYYKFFVGEEFIGYYKSYKEYEEGHIPNAILIELDKIEDIVDIISDKNNKIYLYCRSGRRSQIAADIVNKLGYINAINIGGIIDYKGKII